MNERIQKQLALGKDLKALAQKVCDHLKEMQAKHPAFTKVDVLYDQDQCRAFLTLKEGPIYIQNVLHNNPE